MASTQCKAWTFTSGGYPTALRLSSLTPPSKNEVKPNHILVKIHSAALNPVDIQIMNLPVWSIPLPLFTAEKTMCSDFAATVIQGGEGSGFSEGDEVFGVAMKPFNPCGGTLSEIAHLDLSSTCLTRKKKEWSFNQAAGLPCVFLTARTSIERVAPYVDSSTSKRVVILGGSSGCGIYGVQIAKKRGWKVLSTCSGRNVDFVRNTLGADEVVDYTTQNVREEVRKFKPDAIIDNVGGTDCIGLSKRYITIVGDKTSRITMGKLWQGIKPFEHVVRNYLHRPVALIFGALTCGPLTYYVAFTPRQWIRWALGRLGLVEKYDIITLDLKPQWLEESKELPSDKIIIDSTFAFDDAKQAYERLNTSRARGKIIVEVSN